MDHALFLSMIFFAGCVYCFYLGMYIISLDFKRPLNQIFFLISAALCLWLFCFSIANNAVDIKMVLFWRRLSVLGWGFIYAFVLHYSILITKKNHKALNSWFYILMYLPAILIVFVFSISPLAPERYTFIKSTSGWVNISPFDNIWDWFFIIYCTGYILISLYLFYNRGRRTEKKSDKIQARIIITSFFIATVFGYITDFVFNKYTTLRVLQLAPLMGLIPLTAIFYCIKKYGLMRPEEARDVKPGMILSESALSRYYKAVSYVYIISSLLIFVIQYYFKKDTLAVIFPVGSLFFVTGIIIWLIPIFIKKDRIRDIVFAIILSLSIPLITILHLSPYSTIVWALPTILILISILYNNRFLLLSIGASSLFIQVYLWIKAPEIDVWIDSAVYLKRISFFITFLFVAYYIYRVYLLRLKDNEDKIKLQQIVADISAHFVSASVDTIDDRIYDVLSISGNFFKADRAFVYMFSNDKLTHEWCNNNIISIFGKTWGLLEEYLPNLKDKGIHNRLTEIPGIEILDGNNGQEMFLKSDDTRLLLPIPLISKNKEIGVITYVLNSRFCNWKRGYQNVLETLANILSDTLARIESETHIIHLVYHNSLTDLPNKRYFDKFVTTELTKDLKHKRALLLVNYKDFSLINITYGYNYSNKIIKKTAKILLKFCNDNRIIFHVSIDHFAIWINSYKDRIELEKLCVSIIQSLMETFTNKVKGGNIGIVEIEKYDEDSDTLLKYATIAANSMKDNKVWGYSFFSDHMEINTNKKRQIEEELKQISNGDNGNSKLYLKYQPIIELETNKIIGFEALARMNSKILGEISPVEFIPIAENSHQIYPIGELIIRKACQFLKKLEHQGYSDLKVMLNISVLQILRDEFVHDFLRIIDEYGIDYSRIGIELTESVFSNDYRIINEKLMKLQSLGINVAIDDFGTGYSSFARERELNINCLKIDKYFIDKLLEIDSDKAITGDIISMAHKLGHKAVAEGVESEKQREYLVENDCDFMQGYLFSKPVSQEQALNMLKKF